MQSKTIVDSLFYDQILADPSHKIEYKVDLDDWWGSIQYEPGTINSSTGEDYDNDSWTRSVGFIKTYHNTDYSIRFGTSFSSLHFMYIHFYDENKEFIEDSSLVQTKGNYFNFRVPAEAEYMRFTYTNSSTSTLTLVSPPVSFDENYLISLRREDGVFTSDTEDIIFGKVIIGQLDLVIHSTSKEYPSRGGVLKPYFRLVGTVNGAPLATSWYPQGVYYISKREFDKESETLSLHAFDALRRTEDVMYTTTGDQGQWPKKPRDVVSIIASRIGVSTDSRNNQIIPTLQNLRVIQYPGFGEKGDAYTMREILGYIGALYGGSWIMSDEGNLRIVQFLRIPSMSTHVLINEGGFAITFGRGENEQCSILV